MAKNNDQTSISESQIAVHWHEEEKFHPHHSFIAQANMTDETIYERFDLDHFPECYREYAELLDWDQYWHTILDTSNAPSWQWFKGGKINVSYNCIDRHLKDFKNKAAFIWVPEPETEENVTLTYQELYIRVNEFAALLRDRFGVKAGDRVTIHMPMIPELPISMLACARLGAVHSVVFGGFSGKACGERAADSGSEILITIDAYYRNAVLLDHRVKADEAIAAAKEEGKEINHVLTWQRFHGQYKSESKMLEGRDHFVADLLRDYHRHKIDPVPMPSEAPLFLMYTSGTTGKPKGCQHSSGGYLSYVAGTAKYVQDIQPTDVYWCMADIGWITGHSYIVYGPLALGATSVLFEGVPGCPDSGRPWRIAEQLDVNIFHTAPTTIRMLRKAGPEEPLKYNINFKHMTTVGEPIEPEVWRWYYHVVGKGKAVIVDTYWQTETGGFLCSTMPAIHPMKPGSAGPGMPGIHPVIFDDDCNEIPVGSPTAGNMCIRNPWPGAFTNIYGDNDRFVQTYYAKFNKDPESKNWQDWPYFTGDAAVASADGYYRILGRIDDVINVAGHRLGTKELESAAMVVEEIAEAAVVPVHDDIKGVMPEIYVSLKPSVKTDKGVAEKVIKAIEVNIGKIARPKHVWIVPDMPKTRSGKIMRRVLASISNKRDVGDITTLANGDMVEQIIKIVQA